MRSCVRGAKRLEATVLRARSSATVFESLLAVGATDGWQLCPLLSTPPHLLQSFYDFYSLSAAPPQPPSTAPLYSLSTASLRPLQPLYRLSMAFLQSLCLHTLCVGHYSSTSLQLYSSTALQLYSSTAPQLYSSTALQLYQPVGAASKRAAGYRASSSCKRAYTPLRDSRRNLRPQLDSLRLYGLYVSTGRLEQRASEQQATAPRALADDSLLAKSFQPTKAGERTAQSRACISCRRTICFRDHLTYPNTCCNIITQKRLGFL